MAERRMFHTAVVESDAFLDLPLSAQALYFHIGMHADDDGFVNSARQITRTIATSGKNLELLVDRGFLLRFGDVVVVKHWRMANSLQNDRIKPLRYPEIAQQIFIRENRSYTLSPQEKDQNLFKQRKEWMDSKGNPVGFHLDSQRKGTEKKGKEKKGREQNAEEADGIPDTPGTAAAADTVPSFLRGELGKGVVLLSEAQIAELLDTIGLDGFDYYVDKLSDFILKSGAKVKNHYATILKWWQEDRGGV